MVGFASPAALARRPGWVARVRHEVGGVNHGDSCDMRQSRDSLISQIADALLRRPKDNVAVLTAYFDESGTHDGSQIMVVAGLASPVFQWKRLDRAWRETLNSEGLSDFHTVDCAHGTDMFDGWHKARRSNLYKQLVPLVCKHVVWRTWTAIILPEHLQFFRDKEAPMEYAYTICATGCASRLAHFAKSRGITVPYVFERGGKGGAYAGRMFEKLIADGKQDFYAMDAVSFSTRKKMPALQAADLHAYELHKYFSDQLRGRPMRRSFKELLRVNDIGGYLFDGAKFAEWATRLRSGEMPINIPVDRIERERRIAIRPKRHTQPTI